MVKKPELAEECERRGMDLGAVDMRYSKAAIALGPSLLQYESKLADTMKGLDLVSITVKVETRQSIKTDFNHPVLTGQMDSSSNWVDTEEWTVKRSSTAAPIKTTDGDTPEEIDRRLEKKGQNTY
ncbi:hypothetical protein DVH05_016923 [Phytophthora capsici]|nr:hypothetical protein DVH05_016923 [Phytophthora capsici]